MSNTKEKLACYHCGEDCPNDKIKIEEKYFCCEGCKLVYQIINQSELCDYYSLNKNPGVTQRIKVRENKFAFLDDEKIQQQLISFKDDTHTHITFYLPQMHCSSCLYLVEHLYKFDEGVVSSTVNFTRKEATVIFNHHHTSVRKVSELLTRIGYEPYISLNDLKEKRPSIDKGLIYKVGIAGFCFGNVMMMSFPEYLGIDVTEEWLLTVFRWASLFLSIPVFLYSALPFYTSSLKSLRHRYLNIDVPIAIAIIIIFIRSTYMVVSGEGNGYFDSLTGIVFLMLIGRILQDKTYRHLSFDRDYNSYFPIAVSVLKEGKEIPTQLNDIKPNDIILVHNEELIPVDGLLSKGKGLIDYSFVTGESLPVTKEISEMIYAGGKQTAGNIEISVLKGVTQSYLTQLWNRDEMKTKNEVEKFSFVQVLAKYFTYIVLSITILTALYWWHYDPNKMWNAITAICLVACPCALVLSHTFTNGNILSILGRQKFYLRNAQVIEELSTADTIVFDKTGTITEPTAFNINYTGVALTDEQLEAVAAIAGTSNHPLSRQLVNYLGKNDLEPIEVQEVIGKGVVGKVGDMQIKIGSASFTNANNAEGTNVFVNINDKCLGYFHFQNKYRPEVFDLLRQLKKNYTLALISGDKPSEENNLRKEFGDNIEMLFEQSPHDKLVYVDNLKAKGKKVMMIGDGLNDAGALKHSDVGIAVAEQTNNFTPASAAIIEAKQLTKLPRMIALCKAHKKIIVGSFIISIVYNIVGLSFAVQGILSPLIAAILMPISSISILLLTFGSSNIWAKFLGMKN